MLFPMCAGWDVIRLFRLDDPSQAEGVRVVEGSNDLQKAYKLGKNNNLRAPTR